MRTRHFQIIKPAHCPLSYIRCSGLVAAASFHFLISYIGAWNLLKRSLDSTKPEIGGIVHTFNLTVFLRNFTMLLVCPVHSTANSLLRPLRPLRLRRAALSISPPQQEQICACCGQGFPAAAISQQLELERAGNFRALSCIELTSSVSILSLGPFKPKTCI